MLFQDRRDAGKQLAARLGQYRPCSPVILGLPRGGVVVAAEAAQALTAPLEVIIARKLSAPGVPGLGIGALSEENVRIIDTLALRLLKVTEDQLSQIETLERAELAKYRDLYRGGRPFPDIAGRYRDPRKLSSRLQYAAGNSTACQHGMKFGSIYWKKICKHNNHTSCKWLSQSYDNRGASQED